MAIIKCKMCGGDLELTADMTVAECEFCGTKQTVPTVDNEKKITLFSRANRLRAACEFDKAAGIYESIVAEFPEEAEAYWGLVLCQYGIEYVDDPATGKKIPTCHRSSFESLMDDSNFEMVMEYSEPTARRVYREEAKTIEEIRKGIIEVSGREEPYDIFICYKETDFDGNRTLDSVLAQDIYDALTEKGYRVFFARISLEDKLGMEYEPYIFAALNSAKVMLAVGTDYEYYNAVWVKNEWSRFLKLIASGQKKALIPCFKGIDAYDMPKEFARLQAQDLGKIGAIQDLLRGIEKILGNTGTTKPTPFYQAPVSYQSGGPNADSLLRRGYMCLEDGEWSKADDFFEQVLNMDASCGDAYLGKALAQRRCPTLQALAKNRIAKTETTQAKQHTITISQEIRDRMQSIVDTYVVPGFLDEAQIRELFEFDFTFYSDLPERKAQYEAEARFFDSDKTLSRAKQYASPETLRSINDAHGEILRVMDMRIAEADKKQRDAENSITVRFTKHLEGAEQKARILNEKALKYKSLAASCERAKEINKRMAALNNEKERLGVFGNKRKKEIDSELERLTSSVKQLRSSLPQSLLTVLTPPVGQLLIPGDIVCFGKNHMSDEEDNIQWIVTHKDRDTLYLLARKCVCKMPMHVHDVATYWHDTSLKKWLNQDYLNNHFDKDHKKSMVLFESRPAEYESDITKLEEYLINLPGVAWVSSYEVNKLLHLLEDNGPWWVRASGKYFISPTHDRNGNADSMHKTDSNIGVRPYIAVSY